LAAQLVEDLIPGAESVREKKLCQQVVRRYRVAAARLGRAWCDDEGEDFAEYAVMLAAILVIVVGTIRFVGSNANNAFSAVASSIQ
jgi:Flp pilus assembly pilin Flp